MTIAEHLRARGDLYLCLAAGSVLGLGGALGWTGTAAPISAWKAIELVVGFATLLLPGYAAGILVGLDRRGIETLAGVGVALSLALLALSGTALWLLTHAFSLRTLQALIAVYLVLFACAALWRRTQAASPAGAMQTRWAALGLITLPLAIAVGAIGTAGSGSPATRYTEFSIVTVRPAITFEVVNHEGATRTYQVTARLGKQVRRTAPITLPPGARWRSDVRLPARQAGLVHLFLHVRGRSGSMQLWVWRSPPLPPLTQHTAGRE